MAADPPPSTPGPTPPAGPDGMLALGAALGADVWRCEQVFAVAGAWVPSTAEATVRIHLAEVSRVAGDHAVALRGLLPRPAPLDPAAWVAPPGPSVAEMIPRLAVLDGAAARLASLHRGLLARLVVAWSRPVPSGAAGPSRAWRAARTDLGELRDEGEGLLHALLDAEPALAARAAATVQDVDERLAAAGGLRPPAPDGLPG